MLGIRGTDSAAGAEALWLVFGFPVVSFHKSHVTCLISGLACSMRTARCQTRQVHVKTQGPAEQLGPELPRFQVLTVVPVSIGAVSSLSGLHVLSTISVPFEAWALVF